MTEWQPIETAPAAHEQPRERVLAYNELWSEPVQFVLPDGDWWRMSARKGEVGSPTLWAPVELPTAGTR